MSSTARVSDPLADAAPGDESRVVRQAWEALSAGEVVAIPTDTVYGLAAAIDQPDAIARLYALKGRPFEKAIPILLSHPWHISRVSNGLSTLAAHLASSFWPGALTLVLPARSHLPPRLTSTASDGIQTVAVRVPDHRLARAIIAASGGALAVTSANRSGENPALEAREAAALGVTTPILVIDGGRVPGGVASTVVLATTDTIVILREGAISAASIAAVLADRQSVAGHEASARYDQRMSVQDGYSGVAETNR